MRRLSLCPMGHRATSVATSVESSDAGHSAARASAAALGIGSTLAFVVAAVVTVGDRGLEGWADVAYLASLVLLGVVGAFVLWHRPLNLLAWALLVVGFCIGCSMALDTYAFHALQGGGDSALGVWSRWAQDWLFVLGWGTATTLVPLLLPDGVLPSARWRRFAGLVVAVLAAAVVTQALRPGPIGEDLPVANPVGLPGAAGDLTATLADVAFVALTLLTVVCLVAPVVRWRRADGAVRRQLAWVLLGVLIAGGALVLAMLLGLAGVDESVLTFVAAAGLAAVPITLAVAILSAGLLDIERVLSRTVLVATFSLLSLTTYVVTLVVTSHWFDERAGLALTLLATALVAVILGNLREQLEGRVRRAFFGPPTDLGPLGRELAEIVARHRDGARLLDELGQTVRDREQEKLRIRRDLHDGVGPLLAAATLQVDALGRRLDGEDEQGAELTGRIVEELQRALQEVRSVVEGLRPAVLDQLGLAAALDEHALALRDAGLGVHVHVDDTAESAGPAALLAAFRVTTEAMTNALKHADASHVEVSIHRRGASLVIRVVDDGVGIGPSAGVGVGMSSMSDRALELGGQFSCRRASPRGTEVRADIPVEAS